MSLPCGALVFAPGIAGFAKDHNVWIIVHTLLIAALFAHAIAYSRRVLVLGNDRFSIIELREMAAIVGRQV